MDTSKPDIQASMSATARRLLTTALIAGASLAATTATAVAAPGTQHCASLSRSVRAITAAGVSCHSADAVIRRALAGSHRLEGFSCRTTSRGDTRSVSCRRGSARLRCMVAPSAPGPAPQPGATPKPGPTPPPPAPGPTPQPPYPSDALAITSATAGAGGLTVTATATADDPHDGLIMWATNGSCATDVPSAQDASNFAGPGGLIETEVGRGASGEFETPLASYDVVASGTYTTTMTVIKRATKPGDFSTVCALLYDPVGESPYPGQPLEIPRDHVFESAQTSIG